MSRFEDRIRPCPICGRDQPAIIAHEDRYGIESIWCLCHSCEFVFLGTPWCEDEYKKFYESEYRKITTEYRGKQDVEKNQRAYGKALAKMLRLNNVKAKTLLDVGGSTGIVAKLVSDELGCEATVMDPCAKELERADEFGLRTILGSIENGISGEYDLVLFCRSIDHVQDPLAALHSIRRAIGEAGVAYVDHSDWLMVARSEGFSKSLHVDHPSNFTRNSFVRAMSWANLHPVAEYVPPKSSCYGYLVVAGKECYPVAMDMSFTLFSEIRALQAEERKTWRASAY